MSKKLSMVLAAVLLTAGIFAQSPGKMSYQAVIRNASNALVTNHAVSMQISILQGTASGTAVYVETQKPVTNANGLVSIEIGGGTVVSGSFGAIQWTNGPYFIKTETDPTGGTNYTITGTSQLLSVPYALHANTAETLTGKITETDPVFGTSVAKGITATDTTKWNNKVKSETDPVFGSSIAKGITATDTTRWNHKLSSESQNLSDVIKVNNAANGQIKKVSSPTDTDDAATKAYVDALKEIMYTEMLDAGLNGLVKDIDGSVYKTIKIGQQVWMAENLKTTHYSNGAAIPLVTDAAAWNNLSTAGYSWYNNDSATYARAYGALYNWYTVATGNLCPAGWHVPTDAEWTTLNNYLGGLYNAGGPLKETGTKYWITPNTGATNEAGFTARPGGSRTIYGVFWGGGYYSFWWSVTESSTGSSWYQFLYYNLTEAGWSNTTKQFGFSVRCLKN